MENEKATSGKMSIWGTDTYKGDQTIECAEAVLSLPSKSEDEDILPSRETEYMQEKAWRDINPLIRLNGARTVQRNFDVLQRWECVVSEVVDGIVYADLVDLLNEAKTEEIIELSLDEIPPVDRPLLKPGSVFYWTIGREWGAGGQMRRVSEIRVRRTPQWSTNALRLLDIRAKELMNRFGGDIGDSTTTG